MPSQLPEGPLANMLLLTVAIPGASSFEMTPTPPEFPENVLLMTVRLAWFRLAIALPKEGPAELPEKVLLVTVPVAPIVLLSMAPPSAAELPENVLPETERVPKLLMPPPPAAELLEKLLLVTVSRPPT